MVTPPATNSDFWQSKREGNCARNRKSLEGLAAEDWDTLIVWECHTRDQQELQGGSRRFLTGRETRYSNGESQDDTMKVIAIEEERAQY